MLSMLVAGMLCAFISSAQVVKPSHPRIFIDASVITKLQNRATANTPEYQELVTRIAAVNGYTPQQLLTVVYEGQHYAFYYALSYYATGNISHRNSAVAIFEEYFNNYTTDSSMYWDSGFESRSTLVDVATLYDWLYDYLPEPFRTNVRNRIVYWSNWIRYQPSSYGIWGLPYFYEGNNYSMGHFCGMAAAGYAIQTEDNANGDDLIALVDSLLPVFTQYANTRLKGGDANEGWSYGAGYAFSFFRALALIKTATVASTDHFTSITYDEDVAHFLPTASLPNLTHMLPEGDWARESTGKLWDYHRIVGDLVSTYSNDSVSRGIASYWAKEVVPVTSFEVTAYRWYPFLYSNREETSINYKLNNVLPLSLYTDTSGTDQFIQRTGWGSNDQWISYRAGGRYGDHAHNGSGHFSLFENGWLLIDNNILTSSGIEGMDSSHNCIHFAGMNDSEMYPFNDYPQAEHSLNKAAEFTNDYTFLWSDATPIYAARASYFNTVNQSERKFMYLPGARVMAVFDMTEINSLAYPKTFGVHFNGNPTLSADSSYSFYANAQTTAYVHTCYPLNKSVTKMGNLIRVGNSQNQLKDYFMHFMHTQPNGNPAATVVPVNRDNNRMIISNYFGSFYEQPAKNYCVLFSADDPAYSYDSLLYELPYTPSKVITNYVAGMLPLTTYYVSFTINGSEIEVRVTPTNHAFSIAVQSSAAGVLVFDVPFVVSVPETENNAVFAYYNSAQQIIEIVRTNYLENQLCKLYDAEGKLIYSVHAAGNRTVIPAQGFSAGVYILQMENVNCIQTKKIAVY